MYIDLFSISGKYRGISRGLEITKSSTKGWHKYFDIYEKYMDWLSKMDNTYTDSALQMLIELRDERINHNAHCEIIFYSDNPEEFHFGEGFLGFDSYWAEEGLSGLETGHQVDEYYLKKLNENGLFSNYKDAQEFCDMWKKSIDSNDQNAWVLGTRPRPFCIWSLTK